MKIFKKTAKFLLIFLLIISWVFQYPPGQLWKNLGGREVPEARAA
jgi:hypothetical protein